MPVSPLPMIMTFLSVPNSLMSLNSDECITIGTLLIPSMTGMLGVTCKPEQTATAPQAYCFSWPLVTYVII